MKIAVFSSHEFEKPYLQKSAQGSHECVFIDEKLSAETAVLAAGCQAAALFTSDDGSAPVLDILAGQGTRFLALRSAGFDHVDLQKAKQLSMRAGNVPEYSPYSVAEHAVALLMALNRKIIRSQTLIDLGDFRLDGLTGMDIHGKTIGIVGTGKIGAAFARILHGFGTKLLGYDISKNENLLKTTNIEYTDMQTLVRKSDIISLHCPLNPQTRYLVDAQLMGKMKKGVILINTCRGAVINTLDLITALDNGIIGAAGLDVYEHEKAFFFSDQTKKLHPDPLFDKLRSYPNVLVTAHQSFLTDEALGSIAQTSIDNINQWQESGKSANDLF